MLPCSLHNPCPPLLSAALTSLQSPHTLDTLHSSSSRALCTHCSLGLEKVSFTSLPGWLLTPQVSAQTSPLPGSFSWSLSLTQHPLCPSEPSLQPGITPDHKLCLSPGLGTPKGGPTFCSLLHPWESTWHTAGVQWLFDEHTKE